MSGASPTTRSLALLRSEGYLAEVVERWVPGANVRRDLFGIGDVVALRGSETLLVQTTSASNVPARVTKIADAPTTAAVRDAGWRIEVHGWEKRRGRWTLARRLNIDHGSETQ